MNEYAITALSRDPSTKPRALRRAGYTPCVMYGRDSSPASIQIPTPQLTRLVTRAGSSIVTVTVEGDDDPYTVLVRDVQRDPVTSRLVHVDFLTVQANQIITNTVPIVQHGKAPVEEFGGVVIQLLDYLEIECLPADMPHSISVDISKLATFTSRITVAELTIPANVTVLTPSDAEVVQARAPMREEVEEVEEPVEGEEGEEGEVAEGESEETEEGQES